MSDDHRECSICGKPMIEGQSFYAGRTHWDCQFPEGYKTDDEIFADANAALDRANAALDALRRKLK